MKRERAYYIAYEICKYFRNREIPDYDVLNEELENVSGEYKEDVRYLIKLLNECK